MNKLAFVCVYVAVGVLSVSANWGGYGNDNLGGGQGGALIHNDDCGCDGGSGLGGGWSGSSGGKWSGGSGGGWAGGSGGGWAGGSEAGWSGGLGGGWGGDGSSGKTCVRHLKPIVIPGKKAKIIEHHSRPIYIRSTCTRFVVPSAPVVIKPVVIHKPSCVSLRPKLLTAPGCSQCLNPVLLKLTKNIEQPTTQRTVILDKSPQSTSCNIETSGGYSIGGGSSGGSSGGSGHGCGHGGH